VLHGKVAYLSTAGHLKSLAIPLACCLFCSMVLNAGRLSIIGASEQYCGNEQYWSERITSATLSRKWGIKDKSEENGWSA